MINHNACAAEYAAARQDARIAAAEHARLVREAGLARRGSDPVRRPSSVDRLFGALCGGVRHGGVPRRSPARPAAAMMPTVST